MLIRLYEYVILLIMKTEQMNFRIDSDLKQFIMDYAERHETTVTRILTKHILSLQRAEKLREARNRNAPLE